MNKARKQPRRKLIPVLTKSKIFVALALGVGLLLATYAVLTHTSFRSMTANSTQKVSFTPSQSTAIAAKHAIYMTQSGERTTFYSVALDGTAKKELYSTKNHLPGTEAAKVSPDGRHIAIVLSGKNTIVLDSNGKQVGNVPGELTAWAPDGNAFAYQLHNAPEKKSQTDHNSPSDFQPDFSCVKGGPECWTETYIFDITNQKSSLLFGKEQHKGVVTWIDQNRVIDEYGMVTNIHTKVPSKLDYLDYGDSILVSPDTKRIILNDRDHPNFKCAVFQLGGDLALSSPLVVSKDFSCPNISWADANTFYFTKATPAPTNDPRAHINDVWYASHAVARYNYATHATEDVLPRTQDTIYNFLGAAPGRGLIVANINGQRKPAYALELRHFDGSLFATLATDDYRAAFVGIMQ